MAESSTLAIAMNIFTAPSAAFTALKERPRVWLPLLLLLGGYAAVNVVYVNSVDMGWFMETQLASNPTMTEAQREQAATAAARPFAGLLQRDQRGWHVALHSARAIPHIALLHDRVVRVARRREAQAVVRVRLVVHAAGRVRASRHAREPDHPRRPVHAPRRDQPARVRQPARDRANGGHAGRCRASCSGSTSSRSGRSLCPRSAISSGPASPS